MRLSTDLFQQMGLNAILDQQSKLATTQEQLASGKRVTKPSDDPAAATSMVNLNDAIAALTQYQANADAATTRLNLENNTLSSMVSGIERAITLAQQGLNGTQSAQSRQGIAVEVQQIRDQLVGLANTQDANGEYLFSGYQTNNVAVNAAGNTFTYGGDAGQRFAQIGPNQQVATGDPGSAVFMNIPASGGGTQSVFKMLSNLAAGLQANAPSQASLTDLQTALKNVLSVQTEVGARLNTISTQQSLNSSIVLQDQTTNSQLGDLNYAQAASQYNQQLLALQAAQQSFAKIQNLSLFNYLP